MTATPEFRWQAVGRRKTSVARVYLTPGTGKWDVNGRTLGDYFPRPSLVQHIQQSFTATDTLGAFDVKARCVMPLPVPWSRPMGSIAPSCGPPVC
jgi:ribosomal protein S9